VGGGSGGLSICASLKKRDKSLRIAVIEPSHTLFYQPGWTMVGGGVFKAQQTKRHIKNSIAKGVVWVQHSVENFLPERNLVQLSNGVYVHYQQLVVVPGLELHWDAIEGLSDTLGSNGVTSNYRYSLAPYTWELVKNLANGKAIFTQPPMPIKCAGAPQKAMYLSADHWQKNDRLKNIEVRFCSSGDGIFGVKDYVPALNEYIEKYQIGLDFKHTLIKVDGKKKLAYFSVEDEQGNTSVVEQSFDMLHVCPPQRAPEFIRNSALCDDAGWLDVDQFSLVHKRYANIWGIGDVINAPNAKTLAAVRKQVPVVADNLILALKGEQAESAYSGYGSCPLTVERGKIVLAEFDYSGKHSPTFPEWLNNGRQPSKFAWFIKTKVLPFVYWKQMLRGIEWFVKPNKLE
jgi:sulfide:quinone oxidoreductase